MLQISDLGLTPRQYAEVQEADPQLVEEWLVAVDAPGVTNPAAWFLTGIRSGEGPEQRFDSERGRRIHLAERWLTNAGMFCDQDSEVLDELFGRNGLLHPYASETKLQKRMVSLWAELRPTGIEVEHEQRERASRNAATYNAMRRKDERDQPDPEEPEGQAGRAGRPSDRGPSQGSGAGGAGAARGGGAAVADREAGG